MSAVLVCVSDFGLVGCGALGCRVVGLGLSNCLTYSRLYDFEVQGFAFAAKDRILQSMLVSFASSWSFLR